MSSSPAEQVIQTEGRPSREAKKRINYDLFNKFGTTQEVGDTRSRSTSESSKNESDKHFILITVDNKGTEVLVRETPLTTPINIPVTPPSDKVIPETQSPLNNLHDSIMADQNEKNLLEELNEADIASKREAIKNERIETEKKAKLLAEQTRLEAEERQLQLMKRKLDELMQARKKANESPQVWNEDTIGDSEAAKNMKRMLELLQKEEEERKKFEEETREQEKRREQEEKEERERKEKERLETEERKKIEQEKAKELEQVAKANGDPILGTTMGKVLAWIQKQETEKKQEEEMKERIKGLQTQIEDMTKGENRRVCHQMGVNMFAGLDAIQGEGGAGISLAAKAQTVMLATTKRRQEDEESEGESLHSNMSIGSRTKKQKMVSGLAQKSAQKTYEVEWAHHWLGKESEANPVPFNQIKLSHYMMGEANLLLVCTKPEEMCARLHLMNKLGYWQLRYDWPSTRNVYAAILRGIETGREG